MTIHSRQGNTPVGLELRSDCDDPPIDCVDEGQHELHTQLSSGDYYVVVREMVPGHGGDFVVGLEIH